MKPCRVAISRFAEKQLLKMPSWIQDALWLWVKTIENNGVRSMRSIPGYHDEPLKGSRAGQRSSRLNRSYRVIYEEYETGEVIIIAVQEVNKHAY